MNKAFYKLKKHYYFLLALCLCYINIHTIQSQENFTYRKNTFIKNYDKREYNAANQNWSITQTIDGILYFGNTYGLLEFNGNDWRLFSLPDDLIIRSVFADDNGKIYSGAHEEFGYWQQDLFGNMYYTSLSQKYVDQKSFRNEDIWTINKLGNNIYFHSFVNIYIYNGDSIISINPQTFIFSFFEFNQEPYVFILDQGLYKITDDFQLQKVIAPDFVSKLRIKNILPYDENTWLIVTEFNGLYLKQGAEWKPWNCKTNDLVKEYQINKAVQIRKGLWALGTISNGIIIFDSNGNIKIQIDKSNGLQNNTVLDLKVDINSNLWAGLDKGIDFTEINSPFTFINDKTGKLGSVYCALLHNDKLYIGTNHGIFYSNWASHKEGRNLVFYFIPGSEGQVWNFTLIEDQLICGHNSGTFIIENNQIIRISGMTGGLSIVKDPVYNNRFLQGTYVGIAIYEKNKHGEWKFKRLLDDRYEPTRFIEFDYEGDLWVSHFYKKIFRHKLNQDHTAVIESINFGKNDGFISDYQINIFKICNNVVFSNGNSFFTYDYPNRKIMTYNTLNNQLGDYANSHLVFNPTGNEYWFIKKESLGQFYLKNDSLIFNQEIRYSQIHKTAVDQYENIWKIGDSYLIGLDDGFALFNSDSALFDNKLPLTLVKINKVESFTSKGIMNQLSIFDSIDIKIPYNANNINISFSLPGFLQENINFYCRLDTELNWIDLGNNNTVRYNNLDWGKYNFELLATDISTGKASNTIYKFSISPPWYASMLAYIMYLLSIVLIIIVISKIYLIRSKAQKIRYIKKIKAGNEERINKIKHNFLKEEVANKSMELANYTMLLSKKNKVLVQIKDEIEDEKWSLTIINPLLKTKLIKIINKNLTDRNEWRIFKSHFDKAHEDFLAKLKGKHPLLTPNDLRFCAFLRMNMTSKDISLLFNISIRSIEVKRYRLRKKLNIDHEQNLVEYIMQL